MKAENRTSPRHIILMLVIIILAFGAASYTFATIDSAPSPQSQTLSGPVPSATPADQEALPPTPTSLATATFASSPTAPIPELTNTPMPPPPSPTPSNYMSSTTYDEPGWQAAIETLDGALIGVVTAGELNIRAEPDINAAIVGTVFARHTVTVYETVTNIAQDSRWYRIGWNRYVAEAYVVPFSVPTPTDTFDGRWVDVDLTTFYATAYVGETPVYSALVSAGRGDRTPRGTFWIFYRVRNETMDSATVGIPEDDPEYYFLEDVEYTQYFKSGGFALHGNYWTPPDQFGAFTTNGCIGLLNDDAAWFWDFFAESGLVNIHE